MLSRLSISFGVIVLAAVFASAAPIGSFKAAKACPMYQSKAKKTNPDNRFTSIDSSYTILDAAPSPTKADWVQVKAPGTTDRWVEITCGTATFQTSPDTTKPNGQCHAYGTYDSHVFAISWQAGFCLGHADKPECQNLGKETFARNHFTLHGLWPNKTVCGINYNFCGNVTQEQKDFCKFPVVPLDSQVFTMLGTVMPAAKYGSCLERHEWWKHGTCRDSSANSYYMLSMNLLNDVNNSEFVEHFLQPNIGKSVTLTLFNAAFDNTFGSDAHTRIGINCSKGGVLTEIQINLPKELNKSFAELLAQGTPQKGSCPENFSIPSAP
jgi:ribonuclease T2